MGRHHLAASPARARVALGALPLVATVGAIGVGSVVMSPTATEAPLTPSSTGRGSATPATALPLAPPVPGAPTTVLDLAATGGPVAADPIVPGRALGSGRAGGGVDAATVRRAARTGSGVLVADRGTSRTASSDEAGAPARGSSGAGSGGGSASDRDDAGGGSGGSGTGSSSGGGSGSSGGPGSSGDSGGSRGGLIDDVADGLGRTVSGPTSLLSFGDTSSSSLLSFGS